MEEVVGSNMLCFQLRDDAPNFRLSISADGSSTGGTIDADLSQKLMVYHFFFTPPKKNKVHLGGYQDSDTHIHWKGLGKATPHWTSEA